MNRRHFIQSLVAVLSLPASTSFSLQTAFAGLPTAAAVPAQARTWAVYMSTLHGECTPQALQSMLNISAVEAKKYVTQLVADGVIKQNPLLQKSVSEFVSTRDDSLFNKVKKRLEMKAQAGSDEIKAIEQDDQSEYLDTETELDGDLREVDFEITGEDDPIIAET